MFPVASSTLLIVSSSKVIIIARGTQKGPQNPWWRQEISTLTGS